MNIKPQPPNAFFSVRYSVSFCGYNSLAAHLITPQTMQAANSVVLWCCLLLGRCQWPRDLRHVFVSGYEMQGGFRFGASFLVNKVPVPLHLPTHPHPPSPPSTKLDIGKSRGIIGCTQNTQSHWFFLLPRSSLCPLPTFTLYLQYHHPVSPNECKNIECN